MKKIGLGLVALASALALWGGEAKVDYAQLAEGAFRGTVRNAETHDRNLGSIRLFQTALHFCRARRHLDKLDLLFDVAAEFLFGQFHFGMDIFIGNDTERGFKLSAV